MKELLYNKTIFGDEERQAVARVLETEQLSGGEQTARFEDEIAAWWGVKYAISTNSGSSANFIAVQALGLPKGSEVITPAGGAFPTTVSPLIYHGLKPVFVDINIDTLCLDIEQVERAVTNDVKAIVFAHTLGRMPDMDRLMSIVRKYNLKLLEDCCDSMGSQQNGKLAGTFGDIATCSFYPAHHMTTGGEGGVILTNDPKLAVEARSIRDWGRDCVCRWGGPVPACRDRFTNPPFDHRYYYTRLGMNLKLTEMQAAFGREQLKRVNGFNDLRRRNYNILAAIMRTELVTELAPFAYPVLCQDKEEVVFRLGQAGIHTRAIFSGNILGHPAFKDIDCRVGDIPNSQRLLKEGFFVGCGPHLDEGDARYIGYKLKEII